ncbi:hypothetical protein ACLF3G_27580 [Falsiroseomonas sp. HC035]|uniref:hypothetical protein n=1 Tax=Falsiroseomonas sp. HC035 TaxID=3390999 RepID=UPI003D31131A
MAYLVLLDMAERSLSVEKATPGDAIDAAACFSQNGMTVRVVDLASGARFNAVDFAALHPAATFRALVDRVAVQSRPHDGESASAVTALDPKQRLGPPRG